MGFKNFGQYIYDYRIKGKKVEIVLFGKIPFLRIPIKDILEVREVSLKETLSPDFTTLRLGNRFFGSIVEIQRKDSFFKRILITPENSKEFIQDINREINK